MFSLLCRRSVLRSGRLMRLGVRPIGTPYGMPNLAASLHTTSKPAGIFTDTDLGRTFDKILVANRGEIACRIFKTAQRLGVQTVAVFSDADANAMHVSLADEAINVGPAPANESYLVGQSIIDAAKATGAQAIHPGYGFLSENVHFAQLCSDSNIKFIGPPVKAIEAMGSKSASKDIMLAANVPCVPGYHGDDQREERLFEEAKKCGFPLMIKAVLGGGGKGMRIVHSEDEFLESLASCKRESLNSFADDAVLLERYIERPRHIEFQVFADSAGNAIHLFERDCSVQRRHQKVLEEAPAPGMTEELRARMGQSAVDAARAVGYEGAGTVEFIFDSDTDEYFFMEMNTRLQVEHPVTELIVRQDLVQWQLMIAAGHPLPKQQDELSIHGHSLEARVYAENPLNGFLPASGKLIRLDEPQGDYVRVDTGIRKGDTVTAYYDPMISKLLTWAPDRHTALKRMNQALENYQVVGLPTNIEFLQRAVLHPSFVEGQVTTAFIPTYHEDLLPGIDQAATAELSSTHLEAVCLGITSLLQAEREESVSASSAGGNASNDEFSPWTTTDGFRLNKPVQSRTFSVQPQHFFNDFESDAQLKELPQLVVQVSLPSPSSRASLDDNSYQFEVFQVANCKMSDSIHTKLLSENVIDSSTFTLQIPRSTSSSTDKGNLRAILNGKITSSSVEYVEIDNGSAELNVCLGSASDGARLRFSLERSVFGAGAEGAGVSCVSPLAGRIMKVLVNPGDQVKKGDSLIIMEAMKMEHQVRAKGDAVIDAILATEGEVVEGGKVLATFQTDDADEE